MPAMPSSSNARNRARNSQQRSRTISMLRLPSVTLVMIETLDHELARLAIDACLSKVEFVDVLILTDKREAFEGLDARFVDVPCWDSKLGWSRSSWFDLPPHVRSSHALTIQWDAWVWEPSCWTNEFLEYDIVGAPWHWHPTKRVGNLGFGLRSARLMRHVARNRDRYPCTTNIDDDLLCRVYRPALEDEGFVWAPERLAERFAFECSLPDLERKHFGFHSAQNFRHVLTPEELEERARLMVASPYISKSYMFKAFQQSMGMLNDSVRDGRPRDSDPVAGKLPENLVRETEHLAMG